MRLGLVDDRIQEDRPEARQLSPARQKGRPKSAALRSSLDRKRRGLIKTQRPGLDHVRSAVGCAVRIRIVERPVALGSVLGLVDQVRFRLRTRVLRPQFPVN